MKRTSILVVAMFLLAGCNHLGVGLYEKAEFSGNTDQNLVLLLPKIKPPKAENKGNGIPSKIMSMIQSNPELNNALKEACLSAEDEDKDVATAALFAIPIAAAGAKLAFNLYVSDQINQLEKLKKDRVVTDSATIKIPAEEFRKCDCAILARYIDSDEDEKKSNDQNNDINRLGLISFHKLVKFKNSQLQNTAFVLQPQFVRVHHAAAEAAAVLPNGEKVDPNPELNLSFGVSIKGIGEHAKVPALVAAGQGAVSVPKVQILQKPKITANDQETENSKKAYADGDGAWKCDGCETTDLIPYIDSKDNSFISVTMSVTETGFVGLDFDARKAELTAIKEAIGPALQESLKAYLPEQW